jgi:hypothetical protein
LIVGLFCLYIKKSARADLCESKGGGLIKGPAVINTQTHTLWRACCPFPQEAKETYYRGKRDLLSRLMEGMLPIPTGGASCSSWFRSTLCRSLLTLCRSLLTHSSCLRSFALAWSPGQASALASRLSCSTIENERETSPLKILLCVVRLCCVCVCVCVCVEKQKCRNKIK